MRNNRKIYKKLLPLRYIKNQFTLQILFGISTALHGRQSPCARLARAARGPLAVLEMLQHLHHISAAHGDVLLQQG